MPARRRKNKAANRATVPNENATSSKETNRAASASPQKATASKGTATPKTISSTTTKEQGTHSKNVSSFKKPAAKKAVTVSVTSKTRSAPQQQHSTTNAVTPSSVTTFPVRGWPLETMVWSMMVAFAALWVPQHNIHNNHRQQRQSTSHPSDDGRMFPHMFGIVLALVTCRCLVLPNRRSQQQQLAWTSQDSLWRHPVPGIATTLESTHTHDAQGLWLSVVLVPLLCMALGLQLEHVEQQQQQQQQQAPTTTLDHNNLWDMYAMVTLLSAWLVWEWHGLAPGTKDQWRYLVQLISLVAVSTMWWGDPDDLPEVLQPHSVQSFLILSRTVMGFLPLWTLLFDAIVLVVPTSFHGVWTMGEWSVVTNLLAMAAMQTFFYNMRVCYYSKEKPAAHQGTVAVSGVVATLVTCFLFSKLNAWRRNRRALRNHHSNNQQEDPDRFLWLCAIQLPLMVILPLAGVELDFIYLRAPLTPTTMAHTNKHNDSWIEFNSMQDLPSCLQWMRQFLWEKETPPEGLPQWLLDATDGPRYQWLQYWGIVLLAGLLLAPHSSRRKVVSRKWFHGMAILLFTPVTIVAPQLMSLSYAVAMSLLLLLELVRTDIPFLHQLLFQPYLDPTKDHPQRLVLSHLALIVGCAIPLWLAELVYSQAVVGSQYESPVGTAAATVHSWIPRGRRLLPLWGVLSLGIGDSAGAIVGTYYGKHRWQPGTPNRKTVEGSLAMWVTLMASCLALEYFVTSDNVMKEEAAEGRETVGPTWPFEVNCVIVVTIVTLLEAVTYQLDNLVLPLVGTTLWLFVNR